jgi:hypothetical protein
MADDKEPSTEEPKENEGVTQEVSQVFSVRLPPSGVTIADSLVQLHFTMKHIPEATRSEYLKYLITRDAEGMRDSIVVRRTKVSS